MKKTSYTFTNVFAMFLALHLATPISNCAVIYLVYLLFTTQLERNLDRHWPVPAGNLLFFATRVVS